MTDLRSIARARYDAKLSELAGLSALLGPTQTEAAGVGDLMLDMVARQSSAGLSSNVARRDTAELWRASDERVKEIPEDFRLGRGFAVGRGRRDCVLVGWDQIRALATTPGSKGGYLAGVDTLTAAESLFGMDSVVGATGVQVLPGLTTSAVIPTAPAGGITVSLQAGENVAPAAVDATVGSASLTPRLALCTVQCSLQMARQAPSVQAYLASLLFRSFTAKVDSLLLQGAGGSEPVGLLSAPGVQAVSGTSLALAGVLSAQKYISAAGVADSQISWVGASTVRETLGAREKSSGSGRYLWEDNAIVGNRAIATAHSPASTLFCGGFSTAVVGLFGPGVEIRFDPANDWNAGKVAWQLFCMLDVAIPQPTAFARITSIT